MTNISELKAQAYDIIAFIEMHQKEVKRGQDMLMAVNQQIAELVKKEAEENNAEVKKRKKNMNGD